MEKMRSPFLLDKKFAVKFSYNSNPVSLEKHRKFEEEIYKQKVSSQHLTFKVYKQVLLFIKWHLLNFYYKHNYHEGIVAKVVKNVVRSTEIFLIRFIDLNLVYIALGKRVLLW